MPPGQQPALEVDNIHAAANSYEVKGDQDDKNDDEETQDGEENEEHHYDPDDGSLEQAQKIKADDVREYVPESPNLDEL